MEQNNLTLHETMEIHELLNFKAVCLTKSKTMQGLVSDDRLKALMLKDVEQSARAISDLGDLLSRTQM